MLAPTNDVLTLDPEALEGGDAARHHVRNAIDTREAAVAGAAQAARPARTVKLRASSKRKVTGRDQGDRDGLALLGLDRFVVEPERDRT